MLKPLRKKINKPSGANFVEDYIGINVSQLFDMKIITNVKTPQYLDSFCLSTTDSSSEDNLTLQAEEIESNDTEQCQQYSHFISS